ncbi:type 1 fimbrial protein [Yokenella regensburgei]|uniref:fimbrial protein n=1 Tax=Yokenella regensburgei TaxID=158877 RepID=UPI003F14B549
MKNLSISSRLAFLSFLIMMSPLTRAGCTANPPTNFDITLPATTFTVSRNQPPGPIGSELYFPGPGVTNYGTCTLPNTAYELIGFLSPMTKVTHPSLPDDVYKTGLEGIGFKIRSVWSNSVVIGNDPRLYFTIGPNYPGGGGGLWLSNIYIQFYITGAVENGNVTLPSPLVGGWVTTSLSTADGALFQNVNIKGGPITFNVASCKTPDIQVDLQKHASTEFTAVGTTSPATPFNFEIKNCDPNINSVNYTFKPGPGVTLVSAGNSDQHITLDSTSSASGVGIQVLDAYDTPVPFNTKITYGGYNKTTGGSYTIPMKARYIRTGAISAGTANSAVEFTMTYE